VLWGELRNLAPHEAIVQNYLAGLGGGDITPQHLINITTDLAQRLKEGEPAFVEEI
jgi:pyruvate ferredoxin oxidoreductase alpha subunit/2-oxoisovalerate ferredoxin oxidoreductase alpha subunit